MKLAGSLLFLLLATASAVAQTPTIAVVRPTIETPSVPDNAFESDADDPAVWVAPSASVRSLVVTAVKDGGIRVYDLTGALVQRIDPLSTSEGEGRINNVDVAYGLRLTDGSVIDVVVASDRALDRIRVYRIDPAAAAPLTEITRPNAARAFPRRPEANGFGLETNPLDDQNTVYGLTTWTEKSTGKLFVVGTQRGEPRLGIFRVIPFRDGTVGVRYLYDYRVSVKHDGQNLRQENDDDPRKDWSAQFEGLVVDQRNGVLYAGQEDVGIWRFALSRGVEARAKLIYETRGSTESPFNEPGSVISRDVEGLCIYYGPNGTGYLLASSQGAGHGDDAAPDKPYDDSFAVFALRGTRIPTLIGSFRVGAKDGVDAVQESDGAEVISTALPGFAKGLFITQDGYDDDLDGLSGEVERSNFKFVPWERIATRFTPRLAITPNAYDPRNP